MYKVCSTRILSSRDFKWYVNKNCAPSRTKVMLLFYRPAYLKNLHTVNVSHNFRKDLQNWFYWVDSIFFGLSNAEFSVVSTDDSQSLLPFCVHPIFHFFITFCEPQKFEHFNLIHITYLAIFLWCVPKFYFRFQCFKNALILAYNHKIWKRK